MRMAFFAVNVRVCAWHCARAFVLVGGEEGFAKAKTVFWSGSCVYVRVALFGVVWELL